MCVCAICTNQHYFLCKMSRSGPTKVTQEDKKSKSTVGVQKWPRVSSASPHWRFIQQERYFPPLPDISLANTHYLTWLRVCVYQPSQQSSNHIKVHTPRRCQIIAAPSSFSFFFSFFASLLLDSRSIGCFSFFWFFPTLDILFLCWLETSSCRSEILI